MTYLPDKIQNARILITVKTYPQPSRSYGELVCTAGLINGEKWIRIYPVSFRFLQEEQKYPKYSWIELDLERYSKDFRPESYRPLRGVDEPIRVVDKVGTANKWSVRKNYVLKEVFTSMDELIKLAKGTEKKSLATLRPAEILDFIIEDDDREWKRKWLDQLKQFNMFDSTTPQERQRRVIRKLPYKFSYRFLSKGDVKPRQMMIEDWEIGALFWNCLYRTDGDEEAAKQLVRQKYFDNFLKEKDLYLLVGTVKKYHNVSPNPFVVIGVFYPPKSSQLSLL